MKPESEHPESDHPWLLALYAVVVVLSIAASAVWPYWITP